MSNMKKFAELISKDENVKKELDAALAGVAKDDKEAFAAAVSKVAAAHGFTLTANDYAGGNKELSEEEMQAVAGGVLYNCKQPAIDYIQQEMCKVHGN